MASYPTTQAGTPPGAAPGDARPTLGAVGLWAMELRSPSPQTLEAVGLLDDLVAPTFWVPGLDGHGVLDDVDQLLHAAPHVTVALGVLSVWSQPAAELGTRLAALDARHGPRTLVGLGISSRESAAAAGRDFGTPTASMTSYLDALDASPSPVPVHRRILGALGPRMVQIAASRSAGWHPFLVSPEYVHRARSVVGALPLIAPHQAVVLERDTATARSAARAGMGTYLGLPSYRSNLTRLGFSDDDLVPGGSDRLVDALVAHGTVDDIAHRIAEHLAAGADHVAVHVLPSGPPVRGGPGGQVPAAEWRELAPIIQETGATR